MPAYRPDLAEDRLPGEYRRVFLAVLGAAGGARARELAGALGLEPVPAKVEGLRYKLERLASLGWICESAPGVFAAVGWRGATGPGGGPSRGSSPNGSSPRGSPAAARSRARSAAAG